MILIVSSAFDKSGAKVVEQLGQSAKAFLDEAGVSYEHVQVPGAVEIPVTIQHYFEKKSPKFLAAIAIGCVIKGDTDHYELVTKSVTEGLTRVALDHGIPVIQGVLACRDKSQAIARADLGKEYAETALKMAELLK